MHGADLSKKRNGRCGRMGDRQAGRTSATSAAQCMWTEVQGRCHIFGRDGGGGYLYTGQVLLGKANPGKFNSVARRGVGSFPRAAIFAIAKQGRKVTRILGISKIYFGSPRFHQAERETFARQKKRREAPCRAHAVSFLLRNLWQPKEIGAEVPSPGLPVKGQH